MLSAEDTSIVFAGRWSTRWITAAATAVGGAVALFGLAQLVNGPLAISGREGVMGVPLGAVLLASVMGVAAGVVLSRIARRGRRPRRRYGVLVGAGLILSAVPPVQAATSAATAIWLLALHVAVAAPVLVVGALELPAVASDGAPR